MTHAFYCIQTTSKWRSCKWDSAHLHISFGSCLGCRRAALSEGDTDFPPVCERLEKKKRRKSARKEWKTETRAVEDKTGREVNNGEQLKIDLPCFWLPSAPSVSSGNTAPVWKHRQILSYWGIITYLCCNYSAFVCFRLCQRVRQRRRTSLEEMREEFA